MQGGYESNGTPLYVARGKIDGVDSIGKVSIQNFDKVSIVKILKKGEPTSRLVPASVWRKVLPAKELRGAGPR